MKSSDTEGSREAGVPAWYKELREQPGGAAGGMNKRLQELVVARVSAESRGVGKGGKSMIWPPGWRMIRTAAAGYAMAGLLIVAAAVAAVLQLSGPPSAVDRSPAGVQLAPIVYEQGGRKVAEAFPGGDYHAGEAAGCWWNLYIPFDEAKTKRVRIEAVHTASGLTYMELPEVELAQVGQAYDDFTRVSTSFLVPVEGGWTFRVMLDEQLFAVLDVRVPR
ncbi:hypothetical protein [Paenibacillus koleovorans]|uniref:hypothetical protein n=1 Tax=Paenibacillus koleovorans TaxID=121608 RepID=UPI000FDC84FA|nr:hypothetical protein [Paenibacillus koleovorans]